MAKKNSDGNITASQVTENEVVNESADNTSAEQNVDNTSGEEQDQSPEIQVEKPDEKAKPKKMTEEEVEFLAEGLKVDIGLRCKVVPFNTITWEDGTIVGVIADKRSMKVLYAIKLDDGRRIVKTHDSDLIQKSETRVEVVKRGGSSTSSPKLSEEEMAKAEAEAAENVGKSVLYVPFKTDTKVEGKITSIVPDQRSGRVLYKIEGLVDGVHKVSHKVTTSDDLEVGDMVDQELHDAFMKRREARIAKLALTPEEKIAEAESNIKKMIEKKEALIKSIAEAEEALVKMKEEFTASQDETAGDTSGDNTSETETTETESEDLS